MVSVGTPPELELSLAVLDPESWPQLIQTLQHAALPRLFW